MDDTTRLCQLPLNQSKPSLDFTFVCVLWADTGIVEGVSKIIWHRTTDTQRVARGTKSGQLNFLSFDSRKAE